MRNKLTVASLVAAACLVFHTGCGSKSDDGSSSTGNEGGQLSIAVIPKGTTHVFWQSIKAGAEAAGKEFNCKIYWNGPEREGDRERQIQIVEDCIVQKVDGVVLAPLDNKALVPAVEKLAAAGIPCAIVDSGVNTDKYATFAVTDNFKGGALAARRMGEILGGKGNVLVLKYAQGSASTIDRENGFLETILKEFPGIRVVDTKYGLDTVETALQAAEDLLTRNKDVQGFFSCNESTTVGTLQALQSQKRTEIKHVGFDSAKALLAALNTGHIDSLVVQNPFKMGYEGVKAVVMVIKQQPVEKRIDTGVALVTKESLNTPETRALLNIQ